MWIQEVAPERLAELFHHYQQALTPEMSDKSSEGQGSWREVSPQAKSRLVAAVRLALLELDSVNLDSADLDSAKLDSANNEHRDARQYFARPGEAEWGC
jgi:hypothetical protein